MVVMVSRLKFKPESRIAKKKKREKKGSSSQSVRERMHTDAV